VSVIDFFQSIRINAAQKDALRAKYKSEDISLNLYVLEQKYEQLQMVNQAMWKLLKNHTGMMDSDLRKIIIELDAIDGNIDGKMGKQNKLQKCSSCDRTIRESSMVCVLCGEPNKRYKPFSGN